MLSERLTVIISELEREVAQVQHSACPAIVGELECLKALLWGRMVHAEASSPAPTLPSENGRYLTLQEVATRFWMSDRWPYRNKRKLPHSQPSRKVLLFLEKATERWFASRKRPIDFVAITASPLAYRERNQFRQMRQELGLTQVQLAQEMGVTSNAGELWERGNPPSVSRLLDCLPFAMKITRHKIEAVYRHYAIVSEADLSDGGKKLAQLHSAERTQHQKPSSATEQPQFQGVALNRERRLGTQPLENGAGDRD